MIHFRPVVAVHRSRRVNQRFQQIWLDVPDIRRIPVNAVEDILNMRAVEP